MAFRARRRLASQGIDRSVVVVEQDVLETDPVEALALVAAQPPYGLVGNLPYAITAPIFRKFLEEEDEQPAWMLAMIQHEVAQRITANPGKLSLMAVSVQFYAEAEMLFSVEREAFDPPARRSDRPWSCCESETARRLTFPASSASLKSSAADSAVRASSYITRLSQGVWLPPNGAIEWLEACEIDPSRRPGTLTLEEWARLAWWREEHLETYSEQAR